MQELLTSSLLRATNLIERFDRRNRVSSNVAVATGDSSQLTPGSLAAGRYRLKSILGEGGMGRVWLAEDTLEKRIVALKEMRLSGLTEASNDADVAFKREFYTMTKLQHPNTVKVFDYGQLDDTTRFITMETVTGKDLSGLLKKGPLDLRQLYKVLIEMAHVLGFIHSRLFVHCDIKSDNVRVTDKGLVKLMDFGLMHQLGTPSGGMLKGSPPYMAPEIPKGGVIDGRTDIYSLGALAFELATGYHPFRGKNLMDLIDQHMNRPPPKMSSLRKVPEGFEQLVAKMLAKEPKDRPQDSAEVLRALGDISGLPIEVQDYGARTSYLHSAELIGRSTEQSSLKSALQNVLDGKGKSLFIGAPAGVGKTRLLQEFRLAVKLADVPFFTGQCRAEGQAPLAPLVEALSQLVPLSPRASLDKHGPMLTRIIPTIAEKGIEPAPMKDPGTEKVLLFEALRAWLRETAEARPFIICVEDLHWADSTTLEFMNVAIRELAEKKAMLLGTLRTDEVDPFSILYQTVSEGVTERMDLPTLSLDDTVVLLTTMVRGLQLPTTFAQRLYETTRGNAFFVTETIRTLVEQQTLSMKGGNWVVSERAESEALPGTIQEAVARRLHSLEPHVLELCRNLAPMGRLLDLRVVKQVSGMDDDKLFTTLDELVERQFIQRVERDFYFSHDTVRQGIYHSTPDDKRKDAHQKIAEVLANLHAKRLDEESALLAYHYSRGHDRDKAIHFLLMAGHRALQKNLALEGTRLLSEGADLLEKSDKPQELKRLEETWAKLVEVSFFPHPPSCVKYSEKFFSMLEKRMDFAQGYKAFTEETNKLKGKKGLFGMSKKRLDKMWSDQPYLAQSTDPLVLMPKISVFRYFQVLANGALGQAKTAMEVTQKVLTQVPEPGAFRAAAILATQVPKIHMGMWGVVTKESTEGNQWMSEHLQTIGALPDGLMRSYASNFYFIVITQALMGLPVDMELAKRGIDLCEERKYGDWRFMISLALLIRAAVVGDPVEVQRLYGAMTDTIRRMGNPRLLETRLFMFFPLYALQRGEREQGEAATSKVTDFAKMLNDAWLRRYSLFYRAVLAADHQGADKAEPIVAEAVAAAKEVPGFNRLPQLLCAQARVLAQKGDRAGARSQVEEVLAKVTTGVAANPWDEIVARRTLADLAGGEVGVEHALTAQKLAAQNGLLLEEALTQFSAAKLLLAKDRAQAAALLDKAEERLKQLQSNYWLDKVGEFRQRAASR